VRRVRRNGSRPSVVVAVFCWVLVAGCLAAGCGSGTDPASVAQTKKPVPARSTADGTSTSVEAKLSPAQTRATRALGRSACRGRTPLEAARHFARAARKAGVTFRFATLVTKPSPSIESSSGYPRLVASLYATTLPEAKRAAAAAGCAEELAVPSKDDKARP
jgi:hypothetical protein